MLLLATSRKKLMGVQGVEKGKTSFGKKFRTLREMHGYSQEDVAKALNVTRSTVANWEIGRREPNIDTLRRISELFSVPVDVLVNTVTLDDLKDPLLNMAMIKVPKMTPAMRRNLEALFLLMEEYDRPDKPEPKK